MIVAAHQPDLLPYSGFWHKMARADLFEIGIYYQFVDKGYQRRVKMRDKWASIPILGNPSRDPIKDVLIDAHKSARHLADTIRGRYSGARYWKQRGPQLMGLIESIHTEHLWQFNLALIIGVRDMLEIKTPIAIGAPLCGTKSEAIVQGLQHYGGAVRTHLAGTGARVYMGDCKEFTRAGINVAWSEHDPVTGDSIVSVLMDYADPLDVVLQVKDANGIK